MFLRQLIFCFCLRFHIEFLKMAASAEFHFNIARQWTSIVQGLKQSCGPSKSHAGNAPRKSPEFPGKLIPQICT